MTHILLHGTKNKPFCVTNQFQFQLINLTKLKKIEVSLILIISPRKYGD